MFVTAIRPRLLDLGQVAWERELSRRPIHLCPIDANHFLPLKRLQVLIDDPRRRIEDVLTLPVFDQVDRLQRVDDIVRLDAR